MDVLKMVSKEYESRACPCCYALFLGTIPAFKRSAWVPITEDSSGNCPVCGLSLGAGKIFPHPFSSYGTARLYPLVRENGDMDVYGDHNLVRAYYGKLLRKQRGEKYYDWKDFEEDYKYPQIDYPWTPRSIESVLHGETEGVRCDCGKVRVVSTRVNTDAKFVDGYMKNAVTVTHICACGKQWTNGRIMARKCPRCGNMASVGSGYFAADLQCSHCGADFSAGGQLFAPRSQWGEETGEHFS